VSLRPVLVIGLAYTVYGIWAMIASGLEPFFLVFVVPGVLLLAVAGAGPERGMGLASQAAPPGIRSWPIRL
jgi:hypothetical protein